MQFGETEDGIGSQQLIGATLVHEWNSITKPSESSNVSDDMVIEQPKITNTSKFQCESSITTTSTISPSFLSLSPYLQITKQNSILQQPTILNNDEREQVVNVTPFLNMSQLEAAKKLGIPPSTLGKKWKETTNRKWY